MQNNSIKVLVSDDTCEFGIKLADYLSTRGLYSYTRKKDADAIIGTVVRDKPDVLICDLELPQYDALVLMKKLRSLNVKLPKLIVISAIDNSFVRRWATENGAAAYFPVSSPMSDIFEAVLSCTSSIDLNADDKLEALTTETIRRLGVPAHIKGYNYLRTAVMRAVTDSRIMDSVTKLLYPSVAASYNTTSSRVERAIRHAIESAWERSGSDSFCSFFGYENAVYSSKPTNSEFIALVTDKIRLKLKNVS
ncbi:MAG: response regulator [Ruminococcus sp.]|nr:response regulator [Ruminococcus sp.]